MLWVGGVVTLAVVVWPLAPELRRVAFLRFSRIAIALVGVLVAAGTVVTLERLPAVSDLWETSYGRTLLVKLALVVAALSWGAMHHLVVRPRLERGEGVRGVRGSLLAETTVALAVLLVAAVLVNGAPPPVETGSTSTVATAGR
jgi:copper transport protein